jgi:diguanylate cyclase (GGDEF)-like protein/PAS domain S-box-containing protein
MERVALDGLVDQLPDAVLVIDTTGVLRGANATAETRFGWPLEDWLGRSVLELIHPDDLEWAIQSLDTVVSKDVGTPIEVRVRGADDWRLVELIGTSFDHQKEELILMSVRDLTQRRLWEVASDDTAMFRTIMQNGPTLTFLTDDQGTVRSVSAALIRLTGRGPERAIGRSVVDLVVPADRDRFSLAVHELVNNQHGQAKLEVTFAATGRAAVPCQLSMVNLLADPTVQGVVISGHDITELREVRQELEHLAGHDSLTGLPNRSQLTSVLRTWLDKSNPHGDRIAVAYLDLDRFKPVNDLYGHETGDELLISVAARLRSVVRSEDIVARIGGDEFVMVIRQSANINLQKLAERFENAIAEPFDLSVGEVNISASAGVVEAVPGSEVDTVLAEADVAMYSSKHNRNTVLSPGRTMLGRRRLAERVSQALDNGEFVVYYQPIVELETGRWVGLEALARWEHPEQGLLLPADFLDIIEDIGRSARLGEIVIDTVCADLNRLHRDAGVLPDIAVNASVDEMTDPDYPSLVADSLRRWGIAPDRLTIEISERSMLERRSRSGIAVPINLAALADAGIHLAVDDFGTGYSSLTHLISFPVDIIKIDRSFVAGVVGDAQRRSVINALVGLADNTDMKVIAEGIDQPGQITVLRDLGCRLGQGFHFARPMPYDALELAYRTEGALRETAEASMAEINVEQAARGRARRSP